MASEYAIVSNGPNGFKIAVRAVSAEITGLYDKRDETITRPCDSDILQLIPYRYRRAFARSIGRFWHDSRAFINADGRTEYNLPYLELYNARGQYMTTLYAIAR